MDLSITISSCGSKFAPIVLQGDYTEQIQIAYSLGFKAVELHIKDPNAINQPLIFRAIKDTGIKVSTIGTGQAYVDEKISFSNPDAQIRRRAVQRIKDQIDFAKQLDAKIIVGTIKGPMPEDPSEKVIAKNRVVECLKECAKYAEKSNTILTLEAINRYETNYLNTAEQTVELINEVNSPVVGLHLDTFHMNIEETSINKTLKDYSRFLTHIHFADSNRWAPGIGHLDFRSIIATLTEIKYQGFLGIECLPKPNSLDAAKQALNFLNSILFGNH